jgi:hypothetical protein
MVRRRPIRNASTVGSGRTSPWLGRSGEDAGKQFGRLGRASYLGRGRRSCRRTDDQIGLGHVQPGIKQAGDDADLPRIACRSATTEDQRSLARGARPPYGAGPLAGPRPVAVPWRVDRGDREPVAGPVARPVARHCPTGPGHEPWSVPVQAAAVARQEQGRAVGRRLGRPRHAADVAEREGELGDTVGGRRRGEVQS